MLKKTLYSTLTAVLLLSGCGSNNSTAEQSPGTSVVNENDGETTPKPPKGYTYKVINNRGDAVESKLGKLTIRLYSNVDDNADSKSLHKGVVVNINGKDSKTMPIQASYLNDDIVVSVYGEDSKLITSSDAIKVTDDVPVILVDLTI